MELFSCGYLLVALCSAHATSDQSLYSV